eukprot:TRINITY_DN4279_c0_g4_i1.p1 TRINITY_DN4279_c0_g4~~TRINITY_DN4279_c0_g4_i1.p1  ORF type:complete len:218 (-),score=24.26 TRINITY_DN4279_c0_g4_i1:316-912(-)
MSTKEFREAEALGVDVANAGHVEYSLAIWVCMILMITLCNTEIEINYLSNGWKYLNIAVVVLSGALLITFFCCQKEDGRSFSLRAANRIASIALALTWISESIMQYARVDERIERVIMLSINFPNVLLLISLGVLGLRRISGCPGCGRCLAQALVGRGLCDRYLSTQLPGCCSDSATFSETESGSEGEPIDPDAEESE